MPGLQVLEANKILDFVLGSGSPATLWAALCSVLPTSGDTGSTIVEPTAVQWGGYARVAVANDANHWPAASGGTKSNGQAISFPASSGPAGSFVFSNVAIVDAPTGGNLITYGPLITPVTVNIGVAPSFGVGAFVFTIQ